MIIPKQVHSSKATGARPDLYPAENLINAAALAKNFRAVLTSSRRVMASHVQKRPGSRKETGPTTSSPPASLPAPVLTFTLLEAAEISGFGHWGYVFSSQGAAIGHEPSKIQFRFFDRNDEPIGAPVGREISAPTRQRAHVLSLPSTSHVKRIEVELSDNFEHLSGGDRAGLGEVRFLSGYAAQ